MQTLTISRTGGRSNYTLSPTRNTGELQDKFAKCTGKSRKSAIRDLRTKGNFPKFEAGMSTADYVKMFEALGTPCKPVEWEQLNEEPCTLYSGADTCETLPEGFANWEDFDAAQSADAAPESTLAAANDDAAPTVPDPEPAAPGAIVAADSGMLSDRERAEFDRVAAESMAPAWSADVNGAVRRGLDRTPIQNLPNYARMAIERADADSGLRSTAKVSELVRAYAATYGAIAEEWEIASALYICGRRFWDFDAAPDGDGPTASPTATHSEPAPARPVYASDHLAWMDVENGRAEPDEYQARVIECFGEVKAGGLFYNSDTYPATAALMTARYGYPDWRGDRGQSDGVANPFGMDCYRANSVIRARAERERERGAAATFTVGQRFARLIFNDGKQRTAAELVTLDPAGFACKLKAKSGRNSVEVTCSAYALSLAVIRAEERGKVLAAKRASARPEPIAPMPAEPAPVPSKSEPETLMLSHVLGALQCIAPDGIPDAAMLAREADRIEATAERMRDAMPDYSATCATVARDLRTLADSAIDPLPGKSEPAADPFDAWQAAPNDPKPTFGAYSYAKRTGRTVIAYCGDGRIQSCAKAAGMRYVHRAKGFVGTPRQAEKMRAAWLAGAMRNAERAKDGVAEPGSLRAMLESLAVPTHTPLPGDTKPEALDDDETIPAPLDGLDVAELNDLAEFERAGGEVKPIAPAYSDDAPRVTPIPSLRIPAGDPRARIQTRFAPVYLLQA